MFNMLIKLVPLKTAHVPRRIENSSLDFFGQTARSKLLLLVMTMSGGLFNIKGQRSEEKGKCDFIRTSLTTL